MSAGVSDQRMKGQGNQVNSSNKNVDTDSSIPWSQQVDEAYENLSSPTEGNQSGSYDSSSGGGGTQFQYPPFNAKENSGAWSGNKSSKRYSSNNDNYDNDGMYNQSYGHQQQQQQQQSSSYNYFSRNGDTSWAAQVNAAQQQQHSNSRRTNNYDDYYNRSERNNSHQNDNFKPIQRGMQNLGLDNHENRSSSAATSSTLSNAATNAAKAKTAQTATVPKTITYASVASQPAKPTLRTSSTSSTLKKKGPGMPPPPMVPGKHNMDIGTWDSPKNGPVLVPPPPLPVIPVPSMEPSPLSQTKPGSNSSNNNNNDAPLSSSKAGEHISHSQQNQKMTRSGQQASNDSNQGPDARSSNQNVRPPWISQNNPPPGPKGTGMYSSQQQQRPNTQQNQGHRGGPTSSGDDKQNFRSYYREGDAENNYRRGGNHPSQQHHQPPRPAPAVSPVLSNASSDHPLLEELRDKNNYNPPELDLENADLARFFVIKSYSEDDVHRSIKYEIWCSTEHGNKRLDEAFRERERRGGIVYLFFSVNGSGHFCGMAQMMTPVDYNSVSHVWSQDKWKGKFKVRWIYVKDVPNSTLRHIRLENNENRSVTHSRDTQEVPNAQGIEVLSIFHSYSYESSIFDDFTHYEKKQEEADSKKYDTNFVAPANVHDNPSSGASSGTVTANRGIYRSGDFERNTGFGRSDDKGFHANRERGGPSDAGPNNFRDRNLNRSGGYHNFENRRNDEHRGYNDRNQRDNSFRDGGRGESGINNRDRDNRENSGEFYNNRGYYKVGDFNRRDVRNYNNRDRDNYNDGGNNHSGGFSRGGGGGGGGGDNNTRNIPSSGGGGFRDNFNRDRDFHSRGRGRTGGHRN